MKTKIYYIIASLLTLQLSTAQVLFSENFDNLAVGEVSTDPTGTTPGKGGWYVKKFFDTQEPNVMIAPETGRGNVLAIGSRKDDDGLGTNTHITQKNINTLWTNRTVGYNVFKLEYDIYLVSNNQYRIDSNVGLINETKGRWHLKISMANHINGIPSTTKANLSASYYDTASTPNSKHIYLGANNTPEYDNFPYNTWLSVELFIDYKYEAGTVIGGKIYVYIPVLNILKTADFTHSEIIDLLGVGGGGRGDLPVAVKYDNIKLTALQTIPSYILSTNEQLAAKFNMYPNSATNVVNITNNENMVIEQVSVYDTTGKLISTQSFTNETEIQLNVENLASGTYMLHLQTNQGTAVKKLVKK